jgi:hypothetical protein
LIVAIRYRHINCTNGKILPNEHGTVKPSVTAPECVRPIVKKHKILLGKHDSVREHYDISILQIM